jgi:hypothetical protein
VKTSMGRNFVFGALLGVLALLSNGVALAQGPRYVSPRRTVELPMPGQKKVIVDYGSPELHGRKMLGGDAVPYDKVWRLGANRATHLTTDIDLVIGGQTVPAGTYTLFAIPAKDKWTLIIKTTGVWGIPYKPEYEQTVLAKVDMKVETLPAPQERFLITLSRSGAENWLICEWETTRASVSFTEKK